MPVLGDVYTTLYKNVIDNLEYGYSTGDQQKMNDEAAKLSAMTGSIIDQFKATDLYDPSQDDVTISYIMQRIVEVTGKDYTDLDTIKYPQYTVLCNRLSDYARAATFTSQLQMRWYEAYQRLQAASANVGSPSKDNGAFKVDDGSYVCAWGCLPEPEQLLSALQGGSSVSFSVEASDFKSEESNFRFESDVSCRVPFMWFLSVFDVNHTHEYELNKCADEGASLTITVEYKGITQVPAVPQPLSDDNKTGWFASDVLEEAAVNSGRDETGYRLNGGEFDPDELFGEGGSLRRIKTFVISQRPAITLSFTNFDFSEIEEDFKQGTDVTFKPNTRQCYVAGSGKIGCTQPGPRSIVGGHVVKNSTETEPKEGADFVYTLPICKAHNYYRNVAAMQTCMAVWALSLKKYLKDVSLVGGYENLLRSLG